VQAFEVERIGRDSVKRTVWPPLIVEVDIAVQPRLQDWGKAAPEAPPVWKDVVEQRYVMEEERMVLKEEL
jgi:hypothetical protein